MSKQYCCFCVVIISYLNLINAASISLRPLMSSTYTPSILLLPPGFDSQKAPRQPMLYPFAVPSSTGHLPRTTPKSVASTTVGWIPLGLNGKELPLIPNSFSTTPTLTSHPVPVLEDRISHDEIQYSSPSYNDGPVFESIVYGTWKPDPPLQPVEILNGTKQQHHQQHGSSSSSNSNSGLVVDGKVYNKTINRQHGGFIGQIQQKSTKADRQSLQKRKNEKLNSTSASLEHKSIESAEMSSEQKLQRKLKKQGRQKIRPISSTTEPTSIERNSNREEDEEATTTTITTTKENIQHQQRFVKVNSTDPILMEVAKQINESTEFKYNHKQTSTHSIDVMTTAGANDDDDDAINDYNDELGVLKTQSATKSTEFMSTEPQFNYDDDEALYNLENISATRRSWPTDFMEEPLTTTDTINTQSNESIAADTLANDSPETDPSEIPLALSALNIPPSLWPKLPGNITKLGTPYETESSAEEPALCVPITVRERNMINSKELVFIERVFCFPMPPSSTTSGNGLSTVRNTITSSSTSLRSATKAKVQNYNDFIDSISRVSNLSCSSFKSQLYLVASILVIYFNFIV